MPNNMTQTANKNLPALWFLNGQIVRTNQWGCNCRGSGPQGKDNCKTLYISDNIIYTNIHLGGCGELDIAEAIPTRSDQELITQMYHFDSNKSKGSAKFFTRPTTSIATFLTLFDGTGTRSLFHLTPLLAGLFRFLHGFSF